MTADTVVTPVTAVAAPHQPHGEPERGLGDPVLDNAAWSSLTGRHRHLGERIGSAARYHPDVARFVALADPADPQAWADLATLIGPGRTVLLAGDGLRPTDGWRIEESLLGVQLVDKTVAAAPDPHVVRLGPADVPEMLDLVTRTRPGPFAERTIELGTYLGVRQDGILAAMAGERLQPTGWTEISAVCTDPAFRGRGLGTRLVHAVAAGIRDRGEQVMMHAAAENVGAIRLYRSLGFGLRRYTRFSAVTSPIA